MTVLRGAAATDVGRVRQVNEDRYLVGDELFAVADGVGGHQAGEVAAQAAVETLEKVFTDHTVDGLIEAFQTANETVWRLAQEKSERRGMGTTLTAVALVQQDDGEEQLAIANVGDSRAYLFQRGELVQVTEDHSLVEELVREGQLTAEEAQVHPQRSIITRALGMEPHIEVDSWTLIPFSGDRLVLCSDGLTNEVTTDRIASTLRQLSDPQDVARDLVRQARAHGGNDNITVVVVDVVDDGGRAERASAALAAGGSPGGTGSTRTTATRTGDASTAADGGTATAASRAPDSDGGSDRPAPAKRRRSSDVTGFLSTSGVSTSTSVDRSPPAPPRPEPPPTRPRAAPAKPPTPRPRRLTWRLVLFLVVFVGILGIGAAAVAWYAKGAYFVGLDGDQVAVFRGRPGGFLWYNPELVERKQLSVGDILPAKVDDLRAGKEEPTKADADRYVNNLQQEAAERRRAQTPSSTAPPPGASSTTTRPAQ
jgi:protein phosphatase